MMRSPPILHESNSDAENAAAQSRVQGENIITDHLSNHVTHNPGRSSDYVTWIATLHPENADVTVDPRFFIPGNPWWGIYEEHMQQQQQQQQDQKNGRQQEIPSATAVPMESNQDGPQHNDTVLPPQPPPPQLKWYLHFSPVDLLTGFMLSLMAFLGVFLTETFALFSYFVASAFYWMARAFTPPNPFTGILYTFLMFCYYLFALADSLILLSSILVVESVAGSSWIASFVFGGFLRANEWHQYIRRTCHVIRGAYRKPFKNPPRHFCGFMNNGRIAEDETPTTPHAETNPWDHDCDTTSNMPNHKGYEREVIVIEAEAMARP